MAGCGFTQGRWWDQGSNAGCQLQSKRQVSKPQTSGDDFLSSECGMNLTLQGPALFLFRIFQGENTFSLHVSPVACTLACSCEDQFASLQQCRISVIEPCGFCFVSAEDVHFSSFSRRQAGPLFKISWISG